MLKVYDNGDEEKNPTLGLIARKHSKDARQLLLIMMIADLCKAFNVSVNMDKEQIEMAAEMIAQDFYYFSLQDIRLAFDLIKREHYGKVFRIDPSYIISILHRYAGQRASLVYNRTVDESVQLKARTGDNTRMGEKSAGEVVERIKSENKKQNI